MKRGIAVLLSLSVLVTSAYLTASKWAIRHETISFYDLDRNNRLVAVDIAVRRDKEIQANAGLITLPCGQLIVGNLEISKDFEELIGISAKLREKVFGFRIFIYAAKPAVRDDRDHAGNCADLFAIVAGDEIGKGHAMAHHQPLR